MVERTNNRQRRQSLQRLAESAKSQRDTQLYLGERDIETLMKLQREVNFRDHELNKFESDLLVRKAHRYGIEIPPTSTWWWDDSESGLAPGDISHYLTELGQVSVAKTNRNERRMNIEWWLTKIVLPILQALLPIIALIVALISVSKK